jgi:uncharacterized membrane protein YheB (UPF0754 family)
MPKKLHIAHVRLNEKALNNYLKGKSFMIKPSDQDNEDNTVVKLQYKAKKDLTRLNKNLSMGKGTRIQPDNLENLEVHSGDGLFSGLKGVMGSKLTKGIVRAAAPEIGNILGNQISSLTGSQLAGNMTKSLIKEGAKEATSGSGFLNNILKSKITKGIVKAAAPEIGNVIGNQISSLTGSQLAGNMTKSLIKEGAKEATSGSGFKRGGSMNPLGGSLTNPNQFVGISYNSPDFSNPSERMAYVRSHRRGVVM